MGPHLVVAGNGERWSSTARENDGDGAPVVVGLREDDDDERLDEARTKGRTARLRAARSDVGVRPEARDLRRDPVVSYAVATLHGKGDGRHQ